MRAWWPADFIPDKQGVHDLTAAFNGDTAGLVERGINVGCDVDPSTPGKMDENKAIYGSDGKGGKEQFCLAREKHTNPAIGKSS